jgi:WD40 repeat protein
VRRSEVQTIALPDEKFQPLNLGFSPDGRLLAAWGWSVVYVLDTASGTVQGVYGKKDIGMTELPGVGFTADGKGVLVYNDSNESPVRVYDLDTRKVTRESPKVERGCAMEVGPGGRLVYLSCRPRPYWTFIARWDPLTGKTLPAFALHKHFVRQLAVSADEKWVAGSGSDILRVWNLSGPKLPDRATRQFRLQSRVACIYGLALSADGAFVAYCGAGVGVGDVRTGEMWQLGSSTQLGREIAFHPSRPVLACSRGSAEVTFFDVTTRTELKQYAWGFAEVLSTCFSPDGLRCAAAGLGKVVVWDVDV